MSGEEYDNLIKTMSKNFYGYLNTLVKDSVSTKCKGEQNINVSQTKTIVDRTEGSIYENCDISNIQTATISADKFCPSVGPKMFEYLDSFLILKNISFKLDDSLKQKVIDNIRNNSGKISDVNKAINNIQNLNEQMYDIDKEKTLKNIENNLTNNFLNTYSYTFPNNQGFYFLLRKKLTEYIYFMITFLKKMSYQKFNNIEKISDAAKDLETLKDMNGNAVNLEMGTKNICMQNININQDQDIELRGKIICKNSEIKFDQESIIDAFLSCVENGPSLYQAFKGDEILKKQYLNPSSGSNKDSMPACSIEKIPITSCINDKIKYKIRVLNESDCSATTYKNGDTLDDTCDNNCYVSDFNEWTSCKDGSQYRTRTLKPFNNNDNRVYTKYENCPNLVEYRVCSPVPIIPRKPENLEQNITNPYNLSLWIKENKNILIIVLIIVVLFVFILYKPN